jgi:SAM-dependent methyltransferase
MTGAAKDLQRAAWGRPAAGYHRMAESVIPLAERLLDRLALPPGAHVLDAACGTGIAATAAARRGMQVTALDFSQPLIDAGRAIAERCHVTGIAWRLGDVEALPFPARSFDAAISTLGVIFAPDQRRVAAELGRVLRPGARLGLVTAKPEGQVGRLNRIRARYAPPSAGIPSPHEWGRPEVVRELLQERFTDIEFEDAWFPFVATSPEDGVQQWLRYFGPMADADAALDGEARASFRAELAGLFAKFEIPSIGVVMPREALIVTARAHVTAGGAE